MLVVEAVPLQFLASRVCRQPRVGYFRSVHTQVAEYNHKQNANQESFDWSMDGPAWGKYAISTEGGLVPNLPQTKEKREGKSD